ncbi:hypothetical protein EGR_01755 [Echinococcus granulosus]|uniref:Uncharacterized protein n=2 Tax=Echinococcus granulosus TaxID=6210 RepID=W6V9G5_ECHGR|nr:hypothetical protein EGR_01755 [Echinococcus granulosus]EUB63264.1 hypothetical protein EGR_01755 [Echinococcus granulosus]
MLAQRILCSYWLFGPPITSLLPTLACSMETDIFPAPKSATAGDTLYSAFRLNSMEDIHKEPLKVIYLPIEGTQNVWMYTTILALTIFAYFLLKGIRSMWNDVPKFGARSIIRQMYSVNNGAGDGWTRIDGARGLALSAPLASTSTSDSTSTQVRRNAHFYPSEATSANGCGECA